VVAFLNAAPMVYGLDADPRFALERDLPSTVAARLHAGHTDLGLIPSIEYAMGEYAIVPGLAIASHGPVRSVLLVHLRPVESLRRVALDTSSRTSVALARLLLRERLGHDPEYVAAAPDVSAMLETADAAVIIGDPALYYAGPGARLDLGAEWAARTGLPFVYAFWAGPPGALDPEHVAALQQATARGLINVKKVASTYNIGGPTRAALNEEYLRENIVYALGETELAGLVEFYRRCRAHGLIAREPELRFHGHP
jgi:chorismate dehydratase